MTAGLGRLSACVFMVQAAAGDMNVASGTSGELTWIRQGAAQNLPGPNYDWWHGCSATSAGMLMGYYDRHGYAGLYYGNLVPNGVAEVETFTSPDAGQGTGNLPPSTLANHAIASAGHIADFWIGYGNNSPDPCGAVPTHSFDCLADFMGTNQNWSAELNNSDGSTQFWSYTAGARLTAGSLYGFGPSYWESDGMYGIYEYLRHAGYENPNSTGTSRIFSQYIMGYNGNTSGFQWEDYKNEIDHGRPVMIHVEGHSMFGYGYDETGGIQTIKLHDTWTLGEHRMTWGGSYSGMAHYGVTVAELDTYYGETAFEGGSGEFAYSADGFDQGAAAGSTEGLYSGMHVSTTLTVSNLTTEDDGWATIKFFYSDAELAAAGMTEEGILAMYWWNGFSWEWDGTGTFFVGGPQGGLGDFGFDPAGNFAWINVDHASEWTLGIIPEARVLQWCILVLPLLLKRQRAASQSGMGRKRRDARPPKTSSMG